MIASQKRILHVTILGGFVVCWNIVAIGAMREKPTQADVEHVYASVREKKKLIGLIAIDWLQKQKLVASDMAQKYDKLLERLRGGLVELLRVRGFDVDALHEIREYLDPIESLLVEKRLLWAKQRCLTGWDNDFFELLQDIQSWMGLRTFEFAAYLQEVQKIIPQDLIEDVSMEQDDIIKEKMDSPMEPV